LDCSLETSVLSGYFNATFIRVQKTCGSEVRRSITVDVIFSFLPENPCFFRYKQIVEAVNAEI
jgi:hypothetical protein